MLSWFLMTIINTFVSVVGIYKVNKTVIDLRKSNPKLKMNYWIQTVHGIVLLL